MKIKVNLFTKKNNFWRELARLIFQTSFITFCLLFIIDLLMPGFVTNWFNPIYLLIISLICGTIATINND